MLGLAIPISPGRKPGCKQGERKALPWNYTANDWLAENRAALSHLHTNSAEGKNKHEPRGQEGKQMRKYGGGGGGIGVEEQKGLSACAFLLDPSKEPLQTRGANQQVPR